MASEAFFPDRDMQQKIKRVHLTSEDQQKKKLHRQKEGGGKKKNNFFLKSYLVIDSGCDGEKSQRVFLAMKRRHHQEKRCTKIHALLVLLQR